MKTTYNEINLKVLGTLMMYVIFKAHGITLEDDSTGQDGSEVKVRAVFINCKINEKQLAYGTETSRFQREELFKHNSLRDCNKKLALTLKMSSTSSQSLGDEYIPIEHVLEGGGARVRLLNPYVLRLRRQPPCKAYRLRESATFRGLLTYNENIYGAHCKKIAVSV